MDYYLQKPWDPPDRLLYPVIDDLLDDWRAAYRPGYGGVRVIASRFTPAAHDVKDFLARNHVPYEFFDLEASGERGDHARQLRRPGHAVSGDVRAELGALEVSEGLTDPQLQWLADHGSVLEFRSGETVFREGDPADGLSVILEGSLELLVVVGGQLLPAWTPHAGAVTGLLPYSRMQSYTGRGRAVGRLRLLRILREHFPAMLQTIPELGQRMVSLMADRVRDATRLMQQREKMSALGTMAAGLAHELNNPAGAVRRDAEALSGRLRSLGRLAGDLCAAGLDGAAIGALSARVEELGQRPAPALDGLARSRSEDAIGEWLEGRGMDDPWNLAGTLVDADVTLDDLDALAGGADAKTAAAIVLWTEALVAATRLSHDIGRASARISELVKSVKVIDTGGRKIPIVSVTILPGNHRLGRPSVSTALPAVLPMIGLGGRELRSRFSRRWAALRATTACPSTLRTMPW